MSTSAQCNFCGGTFEAANVSRRYCSRRCRQARWEHDNPEKVRAAQRSARAKKPAHYVAVARAWYVANRDRALENSRRWARDNGDLKTLYVGKRRAREAVAVPRGDWRRFLAGRAGSCAYCGRSDVRLTADHVVPLSRGGRHEPANLVWACRSCNSRKSAKDELQYRAELALEEFIRGRRGGCSERRWTYRTARAWTVAVRGARTREINRPRAITMKIARSAKIPR